VRTLKGAGADVHALADLVEKPNGGGLTKAEMQKLYDAGVRAAENKQQRRDGADGLARAHRKAGEVAA
jgi:hypothetical protein